MRDLKDACESSTGPLPHTRLSAALSRRLTGDPQSSGVMPRRRTQTLWAWHGPNATELGTAGVLGGIHTVLNGPDESSGHNRRRCMSVRATGVQQMMCVL